MTLYLSQPWVPLFLTRTWVPTHCGSWVPLTTERRHGLSISPVQNELAVTLVDTVDPTRGHLWIDIGQGSDGLLRRLTHPPRRDIGRLLPNAHAATDARCPMTAAHPKVGSGLHVPAALGHLAPQVAVVVIHHILLHLTAGTGVARLPLVGPPGPAWLRGLLGVPPRRRRNDHILITDGLAIHPGPVTHHLRPIIACPLPHLGHLHPKGAGPIASHRNVTPPGLPAWSVTPIHMIQTFVSCDCGRTMMMNNIQQVHIHVIPLNQDNLHLWMPLSYLRKKCKNFSLTLSLHQPSRTTQIPSRIVLLTNSWYPMYARLLLQLQIYRTVNR